MADFLVLSEGYHGFHDEFISLTPPAHGIPPHEHIEKLPEDYSEELLARADAVIIEPIMTDLSPERIKWLQKLRDDCTRLEVVLIFDETITAFRFPRFCAANYLGIKPDIIVFGKALANGFPLSCVGGRAEIMNADYFVSSTYAGDNVAIAAALANIKAIQKSYDLNHLWRTGLQFQERFNAMSPHVKIEGYPTRGVLKGDDMKKALFMQETCRAGLLFGASWFWAFPHIDLTEQIFNVLKDVFLKLQLGNVKLEGELPKKPIAQVIREKKA